MDTEKLKNLAASGKVSERKRALKEIKKLFRGGVNVSSLLRNWVNNEKWEVRRTAVLAAGAIYKGNDDTIQWFSREALKNGNWQVREAGANILRNIKAVDKESLNLITKYSMDKAAIVNRSLGDSLAHLYFKSKGVLKIINSLAEKTALSQRKTAAFTLRRLIYKDESFLETLSRWVESKNENKKWTAAYTCKILKRKMDIAEMLLKKIKGKKETMKMAEKALNELKKRNLGFPSR